MESQLDIAAAKYSLGILSSESMQVVADWVLSQGTYTPAADELVSLRNPGLSDASPHFERLLAELRAAVPSVEDAAKSLTKHFIGLVAAGEVEPRVGLQPVVQTVYRAGRFHERDREFAGDSLDIQQLYGDFYSYDDLIECPQEVSLDGLYGEAALRRLDEMVVQHAREWLEAHGA